MVFLMLTDCSLRKLMDFQIIARIYGDTSFLGSLLKCDVETCHCMRQGLASFILKKRHHVLRQNLKISQLFVAGTCLFESLKYSSPSMC